MNPIQNYRRSSIENAPNEDILVMLVREAVRREVEARACIEANDRKGWIEHIHVARAIFIELRMAIDPETPIELATSLRNTYAWCIHHLNEVSRTGDLATLAEVQRVTELVADTWTRAVQMARGEVEETPEEGQP